jgi:hypothetical protein
MIVIMQLSLLTGIIALGISPRAIPEILLIAQ